VQQYVLGFLFTPDYKEVVLINKVTPAWQYGRWNGVGGKVEPGEKESAAMSREFEEETGLLVSRWQRFGYMAGTDWHVVLYAATSEFAGAVATVTEERVALVKTDWSGLNDPNVCIANVGYLIPAARDVLRNPRGPERLILTYG